ncbi:MAG: HigA family addiction module antidote protein [Bacteroidales bacterium]|nr:HigA family addiction module antidote protein [Bacteroidales bacterium]
MNRITPKNVIDESTTPFIATHPGELIKDELAERKMTQKQLADITGIKTSILSQTINGKRSISLNMAVKLEKALDIPADLWMNLQTQYNIDSANILKRQTKQLTATIHLPVQDRNLIKDLSRKFGWVCLF